MRTVTPAQLAKHLLKLLGAKKGAIDVSKLADGSVLLRKADQTGSSA